jgi:hypothetical protein
VAVDRRSGEITELGMLGEQCLLVSLLPLELASDASLRQCEPFALPIHRLKIILVAASSLGYSYSSYLRLTGGIMTFDHGWQPCRACHIPEQGVRVEGEWHLRANPGYWGSSSPQVLVLGFSKGANQIAAAESGSFDGVAFARMRDRLQQVLETLEIDLDGQTIDQALSAQGRVLGAASLIRCGLSVLKDGKLVTSGTIMPKAARNHFTRDVMATCVSRHQRRLPASVTTVVLLGTTDAYIKEVKALLRSQFSDYQDVNDVAFTAQGCTWVFAAHPSPANGKFKNWLNGGRSSASGRKRLLALQALGKMAATPAPDNVSATHLAPLARLSPSTNGACPVHRPIAATSASVKQAELLIASRFERIKRGSKKVVGFQTELGRHLALQLDVQSISVWTEDLDPPEQFASYERYAPTRSRHSNLASQAPRVATGKAARLWKLNDATQLEALMAWYARA